MSTGPALKASQPKMSLKFSNVRVIAMEYFYPRCRAMTKRRTQCRRRANSTMITGDRHTEGPRIHEVCELHWEHPPKEWWPRHGW